MLKKLGSYQFIVEWYKFRVLTIIPTITTKKMTKNYIEKEMKKESKWYTRKKLNTNEGIIGRTKEQKWYDILMT